MNIAQQYITTLPSLPWMIPNSFGDVNIGLLQAATSGPHGVQWFWTPPEEDLPIQIIDHERKVLDPASLSYCLKQMAKKRPELAELCQEIIQLLDK